MQLPLQMQSKHRKLVLRCLLVLPLILLVDYCGLLTHLHELDFERHFHYPLETDSSGSSGLEKFSYLRVPSFQAEEQPPRLTLLIKSAVGNVQRREAIRRTWGYEGRFSDVQLRRIFLLGQSALGGEKDVAWESREHGDILQADFADSYFNNTLKTMLGMRWASQQFNRSDFYLFVDDDYYVSAKNVLRFLGRGRRSHQPELLFAGHVFQTSPLRHKFSKWYVSLEEYPFDRWPPYVTAGAFVLSRKALLLLYATSLHLPLFRFDDIHLGIVALKAGIPLQHCEDFRFHRPNYRGPDSYASVIASHEFGDPAEMSRVWNECRSANYA
ncbi:beta-1,3-galactosyltransferase brn [Drosophila takahashii]|uniref:beta-1,3-galactosyltransferase brn n=1 Tax=Drosophila takahashii TaxID=29030 RepID=UPI001CF8B6BA|nr:beta-1,3-galactosyltransferase brn [Drosophila takahashii]